MNLHLKGGVYAQTRRVKLSAVQRSELWNHWKAGQSLHEIGRALGKDHVVIQFLLARHGGIAPATRRRSLATLTLAEREDISRGIACGSSTRQIARGLQRAVSTVSREVARHGGRPQYRANDPLRPPRFSRPIRLSKEASNECYSPTISCAQNAEAAVCLTTSASFLPKLKSGQRIWIVTEADRSSPSILQPEEY
jgi:Helix-turn-helix domain